MCGALEEELAAVRASESARRIPVHGGRQVGKSGSDWLYVFGLRYPVALPDEVPLRIELPGSGDGPYMGQLVGSTAFEVTVSCGVRLPGSLLSASISVDSSFLLEQLGEALAGLEEEDCELALELFGLSRPRRRLRRQAPDTEILGSIDRANAFQVDAVGAALDRDVTYVWGPPGTGKTTTLAMIGAALVRSGLRVLAVGSTNVAVDNAVIKLAEWLPDGAQVVRFGTPQLAVLREAVGGGLVGGKARGQLLHTMPLPFWEDAAGPGAGASGEPSPAEAATPSGPRPHELVQVISARRQPLPEEESRRQRELRQAAVVGATLSRLSLSPELLRPGFDAVLIDEASTAPLPGAFLAASLARRKVVALGDPKQLPPVSVADTPLARRWLQRDLFAQAELEDEDERAVLLREQYRMHPDVSRLANELVYQGRLVDGVGRLPAGGVRLVDTSDEGGRCIRVDGSRQNELHAERVVELAAELLGGFGPSDDERPVAIITPYRAQARVVWRLLRDARLDKRVDVGTVHRFQGLEREAVIFDTVESDPERPAPFVSGGRDSEAMRLINVAITRARSRLVVVANVRHLAQWLRPGSILLGLIGLLEA